MRARFFALLILILFLGIPGGLYWYFFYRQVASLMVSIPGQNFSVHMQGTIGNDNLPLADRLLEFHKECYEICEFDAIAPLQYQLTITSTGKTQISDQISLMIAESKILTYALQDEIKFSQIQLPIIGSADIGRVMIARVKKIDTNAQYKLVGVDRKNTVYAERRRGDTREIGIVSFEGFSPVLSLPDQVNGYTIDSTGRYVVISIFTQKTLLYDGESGRIDELPLSDVRGYVPGDDKKVLTNSGIYLLDHGIYMPNQRFTDWLDLSPTVRIGYIAGDDTDRLYRSNFPAGESVLIFLDKNTGESYILKRGLKIQFLFFYNDIPVYLDENNQLFSIDIPHI